MASIIEIQTDLQKLINQNITQAELCRVLKQNQKDL